MMGKDGSTRQTAPVAAADSTQAEQVLPLRRPKRDEKLNSAHGNQDRERTAPMQSRRPSHEHATHGMLDRSLQAQLGRQLRAIFADVAEEPVPERFIKLLEALEAREQRR
jgi:hypothetical protein